MTCSQLLEHTVILITMIVYNTMNLFTLVIFLDTYSNCQLSFFPPMWNLLKSSFFFKIHVMHFIMYQFVLFQAVFNFQMCPCSRGTDMSGHLRGYALDGTAQVEPVAEWLFTVGAAMELAVTALVLRQRGPRSKGNTSGR